jgi:undecaprenyl-diphosphatase
VLDPLPASRAVQLAERHRGRSPILLFCLTILAGFAVVAALMIGLGYLLVDVILPVHAIRDADESFNEWLASNRTPTRNDVSFVGSMIGDLPFIPGLVILVGVGAAIVRRWRVGAFIVGAILIEVATYRVTSLIIHRQRPDVPRLDPDNLPVNQSYPSGHVAAAFVVYIGLALLIASRVQSRGARIAVWACALGLALAVALSRMYRGMHHPLDASAGILLGIACLAIALFATRAAVAAARMRAGASR